MRRWRALLALAACVAVVGPAAATEIHCADRPMLSRYLTLFEKIYNQRHFELIPEYFGADYRSNDAPPGSPRGPAMMLEFERRMAAAFPQRHLTNDVIICAGDLLVARQTIVAVNDGPFLGHPPTHKKQVSTWIDIYRFKDGKAVEQWGGGNTLADMLQLGYRLVPPDAAPASKGAPRPPAGAAPASAPAVPPAPRDRPG